jgi:TIR domain
MSALVFISHSSQDHRLAERLCAALERRGLGCWLASRDIKPGDNFQEAIVGAIRTVRAMVLVFTDHANNSSEIKKEIALASQHRLAVIPLRVEDVLPSDAFLYELSTRQWIDAFDDWDRAMDRLAEQVGGIAGEPVPAPAPVRRAVAWRGRAVWLAAAVAVLAVAGGGAYWIGRRPAAPAVSEAAARSAPAAARDISGKWVTAALPNPYAPSQKSILRFEFDQSGDTLFGTVRETSDMGTAANGIQGGRVNGGTIVFYTQGMTTTGNGVAPYKQHYHGTLKGGAIEFVRQNDVASGGLPEKFTATRE